MEHLIWEVGLAIGLMALAAVVAERLRISVVPLLILTGLVVGPHLPAVGLLDFRFIHSKPVIDFLGRVGVLFLLFYLGLEFSMGRLIRAGRSIVSAGSIYIMINLSLSLAFGWLVGWPVREVLVGAGVITISSSAIVAKVIVDLRRTTRPETGIILGIIMVEDVFLSVYMAMVSTVVLRGGASAGAVVGSAGVTVLFLLALFTLGRYLSRILNRSLNAIPQTGFLLVVVATLLLVAGLSASLGIAEAIGALLIGLVLAETEHVQRIERLVVPFRDLFGAFFFFSFGLNIDPLALGGAVGLALAAVALTLAGNFVAGIVAARVVGLPAASGVTTGLTIISRGEFSIVMAGLAKAGGLLPVLQPFTAVYVLTLSVLGPLLTRYSDSVYVGVSGAGNALRKRFSRPGITPKTRPSRADPTWTGPESGDQPP